MNHPPVELFECGRNIVMCFFITYVPCSCAIVQSFNAKRTTTLRHANMNATCLSVYCMCVGYALNRNSLFKRLNIKSKLDEDLFFSIFCPIITVTQEYLVVLRHLDADETLLIFENPYLPENRMKN